MADDTPIQFLLKEAASLGWWNREGRWGAEIGIKAASSFQAVLPCNWHQWPWPKGHHQFSWRQERQAFVEMLYTTDLTDSRYKPNVHNGYYMHFKSLSRAQVTVNSLLFGCQLHQKVPLGKGIMKIWNREDSGKHHVSQNQVWLIIIKSALMHLINDLPQYKWWSDTGWPGKYAYCLFSVHWLYMFW